MAAQSLRKPNVTRMQFEEEVSISMPGNGGIADDWINMYKARLKGGG